MVENYQSRNDVPIESTWDLTVLFENDEAWEAAYKDAELELEKISALKGTLADSAEALVHAIDTILATSRKVSNVYTYSHLKYDQDSTDSTYQSLDARSNQLYSKLSELTAFFQPEVLSIPEEKLAEFIESNDTLKEYQQYLDNMTRQRNHVLAPEQEVILAQASEVLSAASKTFGVLNNADLSFPEVEDQKGEKIQLTHSIYGKLLESTNRRVRKDTFEKFYSVYDQYKNTMASLLSTNIKVDNFSAKVRNFNSAREAALFTNNIPESVYDTLLETVGEHLPSLHRYVALRKELLGIEDLEMYDMYTPILGEAPLSFNYEEAKEITLEALTPLGEEYITIIKKAFDERWIDLYENKGKRSGAYSSGTYDSNPYILMNWQDNVNWLYTLVHELGHSAHSYLTHKNQPYIYGNYSIFLAEIASTTNENLLTSYLLERYTDPKVRLYIINHFLDGMKGTVYRQTQFAEFEHFMHTADAEGKPLTQAFLSENYKVMNEKYYGPDVNSDSEIALEWSRIPHFYYNYYVFQYATGFAAATALSEKILSGDKESLDKYLNYLKAGKSDYPIEIMKQAGVDMTQKEYLTSALNVFEARLNEFENLLKEQK